MCALRCATGSEESARALLTWGFAASFGRRKRRAAEASGEGISQLGRAVDGLDLIEYGLTLARCGEPVQAMSCWRASAARLERAGLLTAAAGAQLNIAYSLLERGDGSAALGAITKAEALVTRGGELPVWLLQSQRACALSLSGNVVAAVALFREAEIAAADAALPSTVITIDRLDALQRAGASLEVFQSAKGLLETARLRRPERLRVELLAAQAAAQRGEWAVAVALASAARRRAGRIGGDDLDAARAIVTAGEIRIAGGFGRPRSDSILGARRVAARAGDRQVVVRADALAARLGLVAPGAIRRRPDTDPFTWARVLVARLDAAAGAGDGRGVDRQLRALLELRRRTLSRARLPQAPAGALAPFADAAHVAVRHLLTLNDARRIGEVAVNVRLLLAPAARRRAEAFDCGAWVDFVPAGRHLVRLSTAGGLGAARVLGDWSDIVAQCSAVRTARRLDLRRPGPSPATGAAVERLDRVLLDGVGDLPDPLSVSVFGGLLRAPWSALPSLRAWGWSIALPAAIPAAPPAAPRTVTALVGPGVPNGDAEAARVTGAYPASWARSVHRATRGALAAALEHSAIVHVAAHAAKRGDDPLLSWLEADDGRVTTTDLARMTVGSRCVVLSSCDAAAPAGDLSAGLVAPAAALVAAGAPSVIAAMDPIEHGCTEAFVAAVHARLAVGDDPRDALARGRSGVAAATKTDMFLALTGW
jgi:CHAT domain